MEKVGRTPTTGQLNVYRLLLITGFMKTLFCLLILSTPAFAQVETFLKTPFFLTSDGRLLSRDEHDSLQHLAHQFVTKRKTRETEDSVFYAIKYFDKRLVPERYRLDGGFL